MRPTIVYLAGARWDDVEGTDRRLVTALADSVDVLWVEPVVSVLRSASRGSAWRVEEVAGGVSRLQVLGPPGVTRVGLRAWASRLQGRAVRSVVASRVPGNQGVAAVVVASPLGDFPPLVGAQLVLHVTDDWRAGAPLMGLSATWIAHREAALAKRADLVTAVSPHLADQLSSRYSVAVRVLANGCEPAARRGPAGPGRLPVLVGQINERTDLTILEAVVARVGALRIVGPLTARDPEFVVRFHQLCEQGGVEWMGRRQAEELPMLLAEASVGLTPYADSEFNRSSFPLKTLEYLAHGLPCVSTRAPSIEWLDTDLVDVADDARTFAEKVARWVEDPIPPAEQDLRRELAARHTWVARAALLLDWLQLASIGAPVPTARRTDQASTNLDAPLEGSTP